MMIFTQDRSNIVESGKKIYLTQIADKYHIMNEHNDNDVDDLGSYENKTDAEEILKTVFRYIRNKRECYCMPLQSEGIKV